MSYQVLARKWRPSVFSELVGQEHVVSAISNALDNNRLHHAYLFTGTRGVGKTTIARIFSKSLNCETGMSSQPCGQCATCKEIEQGNYIDLLEIDAASRTKVEDTRELLDNVQYKPTRGEYKVYLIDEVHMLSKHSFNALLKTLEEPPPHVKFLLATTDPQKLPVTILSRCLQFNLKALSRTQISGQLEHILKLESIPAEPQAISQLARAAQGSMRDALSLTDQAIAQGNGQVTNQVVTDMLGLMDKGQIIKLVHAVLNKDNQAVFEQVEQLSYQAPDYLQVLAEIMSLLHQVALTQFVPDACKLETISARAIYQLAKTMPAEQVQLLYQIALQGKKDLPFAADGRSGLEMTLLRMLAFSPSSLELSLDAFTELESEPVSLPEAIPPQIQTAHQSNDVVPAVSAKEESSLFEQQEQILQQAEQLRPEIEQGPVQNEIEQADSMVQPNGQTFAPDPNQGAQDFKDSLPAEAELPPEQDVQVSEPTDFVSHEPVSQDGLLPESFQQPMPTDSSGDAQQEISTETVQSSTESLLALKQKLQNVQTSDSEEANQTSVKKSETDNTQDSLADLLAAKKQQAADEIASQTEQANQPEQTLESTPDEEEIFSSSESEESLRVEQGSIDDIDAPFSAEPEAQPAENNVESAPQASPPWEIDGDSTANTVLPDFVGHSAAAPEPQPEFDPNAHLEEEVDVEVDFDVPAFLDGGEKVIAAKQLDTWSQLIEQMSVTALTKQLALHSAYSKRDNQVHLTLLESKQHLDTPSARQQLQEALSNALQQNIELVVTLEQPKNTPFAVQQTINHVRQQHAQKVVESNESIGLVKDTFAASFVENSIKPR